MTLEVSSIVLSLSTLGLSLYGVREATVWKSRKFWGITTLFNIIAALIFLVIFPYAPGGLSCIGEAVYTIVALVLFAGMIARLKIHIID